MMTSAVFSTNVREYKTVRLWRTPTGFGFSLTGQYPCVLTHVVDASPAFKAGLKVGDYLIMVNGLNVVKYSHDAVVSMVAACTEYVILQVAQRTAAVAAPGVQCTCSLNCQSMAVPHYNVSGSKNVAGYPQQPQNYNSFDYCGVVYVGFLKLPLPANATAAIFSRLLSNSLNHFLLNKNLILMQPLILSANRQAICLSDNKNVGYNFILNSVAFVGTIAESPTNMFGLILHCPPNPICVCHVFSTSLTRQQEQYLRLQVPSYHSAPEVVRYLNHLITSVARNQPLCDSSNYIPNNAAICSNPRRVRNQPPLHQQPSFEAEIFVDNFQFPAGGVYTVSERNAMAGSASCHSEDLLPPRPRGALPGGKPPRCGCHIGDRLASNASSASPSNNCPDQQSNPNNSGAGGGGSSFDARQAAMALARSRSLSRYNRKGHRGGSSRSSGSDDGRLGRGGGSSGGSGSFRVRYGSQRHKHHRSEKHRRRQDSSGASGSAKFAINDETTTTTSTTTFDSSTAAANSYRQHYGQFCQSGSSSLYRSRSIDSLINASKEEPLSASGSRPPQQVAQTSAAKQNNGITFFSMQQKHVVIDGPYSNCDQAYFNSNNNNNNPTVSTDASGLALNSLLSPRYASFGTNASETDYDESPPLVDATKEVAAKNANNNYQTARLGQQQIIQPPSSSLQSQVQSQPPHLTRQKSDGKRITASVVVAAAAEAFEARSSTASVETRTEVAGSTLSLPSSSASATIPKNAAVVPITFEALLQDKVALEFFRKFLKSQVSDENLEFLLTCDNFRTTPPGESLASSARMIYQQFISQHSKQPVNLTWQIVANIRRALIASNVRGVSPTSPKHTVSASSTNMTNQQNTQPEDVQRDIYDAARDHVYRLLKKDCYPRFVQSDFYKELFGETTKSGTGSIDSGASLPSSSNAESGFKSSGLRLSSRKNRSNKNAPSSVVSSTSTVPSSSTSSNGSANGSNWNPAKLLSHIIGRAKSKPSRQKSGGDVAAPQCSFRVTFPDGTVETVSTDEFKCDTSLADCLGPLCAARGMSVFLCAIYQHGSEQQIDSQRSAASFNGRDLIIEQQTAFVVFYFNGSSTACRRLLIRAKPCRRIVDVLQWDERKGDDGIVVKEVWCLETQQLSPKSAAAAEGSTSPSFTLTKVNTASSFEGLVRDVQNQFTIAIAATRSESYDSASICNLVKSHFESHKLPNFEDVLNAVTSSHSWHMFDEYGRINLAKALSPYWRSLKQSLAIGEPSRSSTNSKDESGDYLEADDLAEMLTCSNLDQHQQQQQQVTGPPQEVVVNEPRSRRPILSTSSAMDTSALSNSKPTSSVQCRLVRGVHPLNELATDLYHGRGTPPSVESSFTSERIIGVNNINYEVVDAQGNVRQSASRVSRFVRIGSSGDIYDSPGRENNAHLQNSLGGAYDENSCLFSGDEVGFLGNTFQASPYARRLPRPIQMPKILSVSINNEDEQMYASDVRSSTPSPTTHRLVFHQPTSTQISGQRSPASVSATSTVRITESTL